MADRLFALSDDGVRRVRRAIEQVEGGAGMMWQQGASITNPVQFRIVKASTNVDPNVAKDPFQVTRHKTTAVSEVPTATTLTFDVEDWFGWGAVGGTFAWAIRPIPSHDWCYYQPPAARYLYVKSVTSGSTWHRITGHIWGLSGVVDTETTIEALAPYRQGIDVNVTTGTLITIQPDVFGDFAMVSDYSEAGTGAKVKWGKVVSWSTGASTDCDIVYVNPSTDCGLSAIDTNTTHTVQMPKRAGVAPSLTANDAISYMESENGTYSIVSDYSESATASKAKYGRIISVTTDSGSTWCDLALVNPATDCDLTSPDTNTIHIVNVPRRTGVGLALSTGDPIGYTEHEFANYTIISDYTPAGARVRFGKVVNWTTGASTDCDVVYVNPSTDCGLSAVETDTTHAVQLPKRSGVAPSLTSGDAIAYMETQEGGFSIVSDYSEAGSDTKPRYGSVVSVSTGATTDCDIATVNPSTDCQLSSVDTNTTITVQLPKRDGFDPDLSAGDALAFMETQEGDYCAVSDYTGVPTARRLRFGRVVSWTTGASTDCDVCYVNPSTDCALTSVDTGTTFACQMPKRAGIAPSLTAGDAVAFLASREGALTIISDYSGPGAKVKYGKVTAWSSGVSTDCDVVYVNPSTDCGLSAIDTNTTHTVQCPKRADSRLDFTAGDSIGYMETESGDYCIVSDYSELPDPPKVRYGKVSGVSTGASTDCDIATVNPSTDCQLSSVDTDTTITIQLPKRSGVAPSLTTGDALAFIQTRELDHCAVSDYSGGTKQVRYGSVVSWSTGASTDCDIASVNPSTDCGLSAVDTNTTLTIQLPKRDGFDPDLSAGDSLAFIETREGDYCAVSDYTGVPTARRLRFGRVVSWTTGASTDCDVVYVNPSTDCGLSAVDTNTTFACQMPKRAGISPGLTAGDAVAFLPSRENVQTIISDYSEVPSAPKVRYGKVNSLSTGASTDCDIITVNPSTDCALSVVDTATTYTVQLPKRSGIDPSFTTGDSVAFIETQEGDYCVVSDYSAAGTSPKVRYGRVVTQTTGASTDCDIATVNPSTDCALSSVDTNTTYIIQLPKRAGRDPDLSAGDAVSFIETQEGDYCIVSDYTAESAASKVRYGRVASWSTGDSTDCDYALVHPATDCALTSVDTATTHIVQLPKRADVRPSLTTGDAIAYAEAQYGNYSAVSDYSPSNVLRWARVKQLPTTSAVSTDCFFTWCNPSDDCIGTTIDTDTTFTVHFPALSEYLSKLSTGDIIGYIRDHVEKRVLVTGGYIKPVRFGKVKQAGTTGVAGVCPLVWVNPVDDCDGSGTDTATTFIVYYNLPSGSDAALTTGDVIGYVDAVGSVTSTGFKVAIGQTGERRAAQYGKVISSVSTGTGSVIAPWFNVHPCGNVEGDSVDTATTHRIDVPLRTGITEGLKTLSTDTIITYTKGRDGAYTPMSLVYDPGQVRQRQTATNIGWLNDQFEDYATTNTVVTDEDISVVVGQTTSGSTPTLKFFINSDTITGFSTSEDMVLGVASTGEAKFFPRFSLFGCYEADPSPGLTGASTSQMLSLSNGLFHGDSSSVGLVATGTTRMRCGVTGGADYDFSFTLSARAHYEGSAATTEQQSFTVLAQVVKNSTEEARTRRRHTFVAPTTVIGYDQYGTIACRTLLSLSSGDLIEVKLETDGNVPSHTSVTIVEGEISYARLV